jgi:hypothetical protein
MEPQKNPNKRSLFVVISMAVTAALWCVVYGVYEIWTLRNMVQNDTISHVVDALWQNNPDLPQMLWTGLMVFVAFWAAVFCHWFVKGFPWKKAVWVQSDDERTDLEVKKDNEPQNSEPEV